MGILDFFGGGSNQAQTPDPSMAAMRDLGMPQSLIDAYAADSEKNRRLQALQMIIGGVGNAISGAQGMAPVAAPSIGGSGGGDGGGLGGSMDGLIDRALKFSQVREGLAKQRQSAEARAAIPQLAKALGIPESMAAGLIDKLPDMYVQRQNADFAANADVRKGDALLDASGVTDPEDRKNFYRRQTMPAAEIKNIKLPNGEEVSLRVNPTTGGVTDLNNQPMPAEAMSGAGVTQKMGPVIGDAKTGYYTIDLKTRQAVPILPGQQPLGVSEEVYKAETGLRGEYTQLAKDFGGRQTAFMTMEDLAKQGEGASDIALVLSLMKVYDPTSTVTGSEAANAQNAAGVPAAIRSKYNQLIGGGKLDQQSRDELVTAARLRFDQELDNQGKIVDYFTDLAQKYKVDPSRVVNDTRDKRLLDERDTRKVQSLAPNNIRQMNYQQLMQLEKQASKMTPEQLRAAVARKTALGGGGR